MPSTVVMLHNPFRPDRDREVIAVAEPLSIREWLDEQGIREAGTGEARTARRQDWFDHPTICLRNGSPVLRGRWDETFVADGDMVVFVPLPQGGGGGGKNPLRTILMLAVMVAAPYLGGLIAGAIGVTSTIGISLITAGVALVGTTLVNVLLPPPKPAAPSFGKGVPSPSPTYSLQAQGNQARLTQPIPVIYGRHRAIPISRRRPGPSTRTTSNTCISCTASARASTRSSRSASRTRRSPHSRRSRPSWWHRGPPSPCSRPMWSRPPRSPARNSSASATGSPPLRRTMPARKSR